MDFEIARFVTASIVPGSLFLGLLGILTLGIGAMTGVPELRFSEGFFVFLPTDVAVPLMGPKLREKYAIGRLLGLLVVALLLATDVFRQPLWAPMLLPFAFFTALAVPLPRIAGRNKRIVEAPQEVGTPVANVAPPSS